MHLRPLDAVQRRAISLIGPIDDETETSLQFLAHRRGVAGMCCFHRLVHGTAPAPLLDLLPALAPRGRRGLRGANRSAVYQAPPVRAPLDYKRSFVHAAAAIWNKLDADAQAEGLMTLFKAMVNDTDVFMQQLGDYIVNQINV